jgi:hypothetical protein
MLMQRAVPRAQALWLLRHRMMLETRFSNSMDMIGKVELLKSEKIAMQIQWAALEDSPDVAATEAASAVAVVMGVAVDSAAVEVMEGVTAAVEEVATAEGEAMQVEAALGSGQPSAVSAWKRRTLPTLSPTSQPREARRIQSSMFET